MESETMETVSEPIVEQVTEKAVDAETKVETEVSVKTEEVPKENEVPVVYDLKVPDKSKLSKEDIDRITANAKELGLSNDEANDLLEIESQAIDRYAERQNQEVSAMKSGWLKESENDTEIGGKEFTKNIELAKRVVDRFGSPAFKQALNNTGFGNHPEVIRTFMRIGLLMSEDQFVHAKTQGSNQKKSMEAVFYGEEKGE